MTFFSSDTATRRTDGVKMSATGDREERGGCASGQWHRAPCGTLHNFPISSLTLNVIFLHGHRKIRFVCITKEFWGTPQHFQPPQGAENSYLQTAIARAKLSPKQSLPEGIGSSLFSTTVFLQKLNCLNEDFLLLLYICVCVCLFYNLYIFCIYICAFPLFLVLNPSVDSNVLLI